MLEDKLKSAQKELVTNQELLESMRNKKEVRQGSSVHHIFFSPCTVAQEKHRYESSETVDKVLTSHLQPTCMASLQFAVGCFHCIRSGLFAARAEAL